MKKKLQLIAAGIAIVMMAANLESCTSYRGIAARPDGHNRYKPDMAMHQIKKHHHDADNRKAVATVPVATNATASVSEKPKESKFVAQLKGDVPFQARVSNLVAKEIDDDKMVKVNDALARYSNNKVSIVRTATGKVVLKAESRKDFVKLTTNLLQVRRSAAPMSDETRDILALVGGICGIVSIALCLIPYVDYISVPAGIAGIVLGVLGLHSERRHKWAMLGIILGALGLFLAIVMAVVYSYVLFHVLL